MIGLLTDPDVPAITQILSNLSNISAAGLLVLMCYAIWKGFPKFAKFIADDRKEMLDHFDKQIAAERESCDERFKMIVEKIAAVADERRKDLLRIEDKIDRRATPRKRKR